MNRFIRTARLTAAVLLTAMSFTAVAADAWLPPATVNPDALYDEVHDEAPRADSDLYGKVIAVWLKDGGLTAAASVDGGSTFTSISLSVQPAPNRYIASADIAFLGNNTWACVWEDRGTSDSFTALNAVRSLDNGKTWGMTKTLTYVDGSVGIESDRNGTAIITAEKARLRTTDFGKTWTQSDIVAAQSIVSWEGILRTNGSGTWLHSISYEYIFVPGMVVWTSQIERSTDNGLTWQLLIGEPYSSLDIAMAGNLALNVDSNIYGDNFMDVSRDAGATWIQVGAPYGIYPVNAAASGDEFIIVGEIRPSGIQYSSRSRDLQNWSEPIPVFDDISGIDPPETFIGLGQGSFMGLTAGIAGDQTDTDIFRTVSHNPDSNISIDALKLPKVKVNKKTGEATLTAKIMLRNNGSSETPPLTLSVWLSDDSVLDIADQQAPGISVKPHPALIPGKAPKAKSAKLKVNLGSNTSGYIIVTVEPTGPHLAIPYSAMP